MTNKKNIKKKRNKKIDEMVNELVKKKLIEEEIEKKKVFLIWAGVSFFMILIIFVWGYNLKNNFAKYSESDSIKKDDFLIEDFSDIKDSFSKQLTEINKSLNELSKIATSTISTSTLEIEKNNVNVNNLDLIINEKVEVKSTSTNNIKIE